jgi:GH15 family glucan-1,4-alpha-glucosidase
MQPSPQVQQAPPAVDPKAQTWAEKNAWFGQDEVMTYAAFGVHRKLVEDEGFDPQSEEYYTEVDRRMRAEFPNKFKADRKTGGARVASASSSASRTTTQGRRSVKLTPSQIAIANKLNVPLEEYAKYVKD